MRQFIVIQMSIAYFRTQVSQVFFPNFVLNQKSPKRLGWREWMTKAVTTPYGTRLWISIRGLWEEVKLKSKMKVGNGNKIKFWKDQWHEKGKLETLFPDIYNLPCSNKGLLQSSGHHRAGISISGKSNDWELMRLAEFLNIVGHLTGLQTNEDMLWWKGNNKGEFKVHSANGMIDQSCQKSSTWPWKQIWKCRIPHKVSCFIWLLAKEAALTQDNVKKRGITLCSRCFLCEEILETVNHLLLHCNMPRRVTEALYSCEEANDLAKDRIRWRITPASIWSAIWKERNSRCFEGIEDSVQEVKLNCILLLCFWCNQLYSNDIVSIDDDLDSI